MALCVHELENCSCSYTPPRRPNGRHGYGAAVAVAQAKFAIPSTGAYTSLSMGTARDSDLRREVPNSPTAPKPSQGRDTGTTPEQRAATMKSLQALLTA
jgi:hypothetical protein